MQNGIGREECGQTVGIGADQTWALTRSICINIQEHYLGTLVEI